MSGHSKWSQIKRQKAVSDAKRGNLFTKLANAVSLAARTGGDPDMNPRLRMAIDKAREANMPNANIDRAIKRGTGELGGGTLEEVTYEGFGPANVAVVVSAITDNKNRTVADMRKLFGDVGGRLGGENSVMWMFVLKGIVTIQGTGEEIQLKLIDAGAEDVRTDDDVTIGIFPPQQIDTARSGVERAGLIILEADDHLIPTTPQALDSQIQAKLDTLIESLEDHDDVTSVTTSAKG